MADLTKRYPPYEGNDPYMYFAFPAAEADRVEPVLKLLYQRGVRVWYARKGSGAEWRQHRLERSLGARLAVIWLSPAALEDADEVKSAVLYCQSKEIRVISVDLVDSDDLSTGFTADTFHIDGKHMTPEELEKTLIRTEGFSQELMGEQPPAEPYPTWKKAAIAILACCLCVMIGCFCMGVFSMPDAKLIADPAIRGAARNAVGRMVTREDLETITVLHLERVPGSFEELSQFPRLTRVEIPEKAVQKAAEVLHDAEYDVVVYGGGK